jgi:hypothetical protein
MITHQSSWQIGEREHLMREGGGIPVGGFDGRIIRDAGAAEVEDERTAACRPGRRK